MDVILEPIIYADMRSDMRLKHAMLKRLKSMNSLIKKQLTEFNSEKESKDLFKAINDNQHGVLKWIKHYW